MGFHDLGCAGQRGVGLTAGTNMISPLIPYPNQSGRNVVLDLKYVGTTTSGLKKNL